jgi:hypothetical protein
MLQENDDKSDGDSNNNNKWSGALLENPTARSASQEIPYLLVNPKIHYRVHNSPPTFPVLSQMNPVHTLQTYFLKIRYNIVLPAAPKWSLTLRLPINILYAFLISPMRATSPAHIILHLR